LAPTPDQARLWSEAADQGLTAGLDRVPVADRPIQPRQRAVASSQTTPANPVVIPPPVQTSVRIISRPTLATLGPDGFSGPANVTAANGDRIELDLGQGRTLTVLARAAGNVIRTSPNEKVELTYKVRTDPRVPNDVLALKAASGDGIVQVVQGGIGPVALAVPLFALRAEQVGKPSTVSVAVRVGDVSRIMEPGETAQVGGLTVRLVGSTAVTGDRAARIEGSPYTINLIAWPSR
jgi:hypothetical protein